VREQFVGPIEEPVGAVERLRSAGEAHRLEVWQVRHPRILPSRGAKPRLALDSNSASQTFLLNIVSVTSEAGGTNQR